MKGNYSVDLHTSNNDITWCNQTDHCSKSYILTHNSNITISVNKCTFFK